MEGQKIPSATMSFNIRALLRMFEDGGAALTKKGQYLLFALMLPKELRESVVVADDDASVRLVVKSVR